MEETKPEQQSSVTEPNTEPVKFEPTEKVDPIPTDTAPVTPSSTESPVSPTTQQTETTPPDVTPAPVENKKPWWKFW